MNLSVILSAVCFLLVLNAADHVESRGVFRWYKMFVFGDSFADTGNLPKYIGLPDNESEMSRQWYFPYGITRGIWGDHPTGRFSNAMVQSDLVAKMIGHPQAPPPYRLSYHYVGPSGMNFAVGGAGVYPVRQRVPTLGKQVDQFKRLVEEGSIKKWHLKDSVALVAISGNDYARVANMSSTTDIIAFIGNVTTEIAREVQRLHKLGVSKILVNNLHPLGCTPWQSRPNNYTGCDGRGNMGASVHNSNLKQKLGSKHKDIFLVDLHTAFSNIVNPTPGSKHEMSKQFKHKLTPCCESFDPNGYCGQHGSNYKLLYSFCTKPDKYFYWDDVHPTQEGWLSVMKQLEEPIRKFLGLI